MSIRGTNCSQRHLPKSKDRSSGLGRARSRVLSRKVSGGRLDVDITAFSNATYCITIPATVTFGELST